MSVIKDKYPSIIGHILKEKGKISTKGLAAYIISEEGLGEKEINEIIDYCSQDIYGRLYNYKYRSSSDSFVYTTPIISADDKSVMPEMKHFTYAQNHFDAIKDQYFSKMDNSNMSLEEFAALFRVVIPDHVSISPIINYFYFNGFINVNSVEQTISFQNI